MNPNDEVIRKLMTEAISRTLDEMILRTFMGNARASPGKAEWVSFKRGDSMGTYSEAIKDEPSGFTWRKEYVVDYVMPANSLVIEGECKEVGLKAMPEGAVEVG